MKKQNSNSEKGFTLIELLLVVVIIGLMLAVIVPRAWRANIDAKYGLVRQSCSELGSFGQEWAENQLLAQNENLSTATMDNYFATLTGTDSVWNAATMGWVGDATTNWNRTGLTVINGRAVGPTLIATTTDTAPEISVEEIVPPEKAIRNPFNEVNVFRSTNHAGGTGNSAVIPGAIACASQVDGTFHYYAFLFQGTDTTTNTLAAGTTSFYAGQAADSVQGLRNGIFFARIMN